MMRETVQGTGSTPLNVMTLRRLVGTGALLATLLLGVMGASLATGTVSIPLAEIFRTFSPFGDQPDPTIRTILLEIRLPRILLAVIVGAGLSVAGATFQVLLRNPLAEPYILGISSGGTVGAILAISLGVGLAQFTTPVFSFVGALLVMALVYSLGHRRGFMDPHSLLLSGVMVGAFFNAFVLLVIAIFNQELRTAYLWLLGNLGNADMRSLAVVAPPIVLAAGILTLQGRTFNLIATGDETAMHLGVDVQSVRRWSYVLASLLTGLAVSVSGVIGFVGLLIPHACRLMFGPDNRLLLPASFLVGGTFLVVCDLLARTLLSPSEIPVGAITAAVGAPLFVYLLKRG